MRFSISGDTVETREIGAVRISQGLVPHEIISRSKIETAGVCTDASGLSEGHGNAVSARLRRDFDLMVGVVEDFGGVCATYFRAEEGYVVQARRRDGRVFPPGDTSLRFFDEPKPLRMQWSRLRSVFPA
jgi:hypothetical protein